MALFKAQLAKDDEYGSSATLGNMFRDIPDAEARATVGAAWADGIRFFDTAPFYGAGLAEIRLGKALAGKREYVIGTKVGRIVLDEHDTSVRDNGAADVMARFKRATRDTGLTCTRGSNYVVVMAPFKLIAPSSMRARAHHRARANGMALFNRNSRSSMKHAQLHDVSERQATFTRSSRSSMRARASPGLRERHGPLSIATREAR